MNELNKFKFKRVLLKLSGEALSGQDGPLSQTALEYVVSQLLPLQREGVEVAVVIGGGNFVRGREAPLGLDRVTLDQMGMLATVINALALQAELEAHGAGAHVQSAIETPAAAPVDRRRAVRALQAGEVVIFAGGTGNPFVTTDTAAALRAGEIEAQVLLKGTKVDGVYTADPQKPTSTRSRPPERLDRLTYREVIERGLEVMDLGAIELCRQMAIPILVFNFFREGELLRAVRGEPVGTLIS